MAQLAKVGFGFRLALSNKKDLKLNLAKAALNMVKAVMCVELEDEDVQLLYFVEETHLDAEEPWVCARPMLPGDADDVFDVGAESCHLRMAGVVGGLEAERREDSTVQVDLLAMAAFVRRK
jgi:hypothetical protein